MMSPAVITKGSNENRNTCKGRIPNYVISDCYGMRQNDGVLTTVELLDRLESKGVKNADIARALRVAPSRVTEMKKGERAIKLDEAAKLVSQFQLESAPVLRAPPLPAPVSRLLVRYIVNELNCQAPESRLEDIAEDVRAFAEYVTDPKVRGSISLQEAFFDVMRLRRPAPANDRLGDAPDQPGPAEEDQ
jgi:hypothetical protein